MRKNVFGRQLKRDIHERKALFRSLLNALVLHERIQTSEAKAKAVKGDADRLVTKAKKGGLQAHRLLESELSSNAVKKLTGSIAPRFTGRQGGYTRIIRAGKRVKDNSQEVIFEWVEKEVQDSAKSAVMGKGEAEGSRIRKKAKAQKDLIKKPKIKKSTEGKAK